jgi:hypothetical protein
MEIPGQISAEIDNRGCQWRSFGVAPLAEEPRARRTRAPGAVACDQRVNTYDWSIGTTANIDEGRPLW